MNGVRIISEDNKFIGKVDHNGLIRLAVDANISSSTDSFAENGNAWSIVIDNLTIAGTGEQSFCLIKNPISSGKKIKIFEISYTTSAPNSVIREYRDPTITDNGTTITSVNLLKSGSASIVESYTIPTISANGTLLRSSYNRGKDQLVLTNNTTRIIEEDESILLTIDSPANQEHFLNIIIGEEDA